MTDIKGMEPVAWRVVWFDGAFDFTTYPKAFNFNPQIPPRFEPLYTADQVKELTDRLEESTTNLDGLLMALKFHTGENHGVMAIRKLVDRATTAKAALVEARKVIEPFGFAARMEKRAEPMSSVMINVDRLRDADAWLEANKGDGE